MKTLFEVILILATIITISSVMQLNMMESYRQPIEIQPSIHYYNVEFNNYVKFTGQESEIRLITQKYNAQNNSKTFKENNVSNSTLSYQDLETHQDDKDLINRISKIITPPSRMQYKLKNPKADPSVGQARQIRNILGDLKGGFFVECGAWDGEGRSNTLKFERDFGWRGLLIEADSVSYETLLTKNRKAWSINRCLSLKTHPTKVMFNQNMAVGRISNSTRNDIPHWQREIVCLPLYSLMLALNVTTIDYFSLDIEGDELPLLRTIPWDKLNIRTLSVESFHRAISKQIIEYMNTNGYKLYITFLHPSGKDQDLIFHRNDIVPKIPASPLIWGNSPQKPKCRNRFRLSERIIH